MKRIQRHESQSSLALRQPAAYIKINVCATQASFDFPPTRGHLEAKPWMWSALSSMRVWYGGRAIRNVQTPGGADEVKGYPPATERRKSDKRIDEQAKAPRAVTQRRRGRKENRAVVYGESLSLGVPARV